MAITNLPLFYFISIPILIFGSRVLTKTIRLENNCSNTIWAAVVPGGGKKLNKGAIWTLDVKPGTKNASIWARTNCNFDGAGRGKCESGDCGGLLECRAKGQPPYTLAELALNQYDNFDRFGISLLNGFNVPIEFSPTLENCTETSKCAGDVNGPCPQELRDPGGCNNPCTVFTNDQFCCTSETRCEPTNYSMFFKAICPDALTYPTEDDSDSLKYCSPGTNYTVVFCPSVSSRSQNAKVTIKNNCPSTIWPATQIGGEAQLSITGFELSSGASNTIDVSRPWNGRFWARTRCTTDASGKFICITGDCGSGLVSCNGYIGAPPATLIEISLQPNGGQDFYDISNVDGFNIPASVTPQGGFGECKPSRCSANINAVCKPELQVKTAVGEVIGCKGACGTFNEPKYCCTGEFNKPETCLPTAYSRFFKEQCPEAYSYAYDDRNSTFTCSGGPDYLITFCPRDV